MNKTELRICAKEIRSKIAGRDGKNVLLTDRACSLIERLNLKSVFTYVSMSDEVDTRELIKKLFEKGIKVCVPHTENSTMSVITLDTPLVNSVDKLGNIKDDKIRRKADFACDCAVVPMLAFDKTLNRLGYGKGCYDRFFVGYGGYKIGLAYDEQEVGDVCPEHYDMPLDFILTPTRLLESGRNKVI